MNAKQTGSVIVAVIGALIFGAAFSAFRTVGPDAITAGGDFSITQIVNVLGMLLGGGLTLTGGGLLAWIKGHVPERVGPLLDGLAGRLQRGQDVDGPLVATVVGLQAMRSYFADCEPAKEHLDALATLAWEVDSQRMKPTSVRGKAV